MKRLLLESLFNKASGRPEDSSNILYFKKMWNMQVVTDFDHFTNVLNKF